MNTSFGITTQDPFPQPNLANLAGPAPHPSMEMLLQAVSTSTPSWSGPSMAERQPRPAFYHGNMNAITSVPQSSQIPTGYINLGLPTDSSSLTQPEQAYSTEEGIADVFGWGVDSADWMQLYDSMGMDSNLVAPADLAQMLQPHTQSQTVFTPQHPVYMPSATTGSSAWMAGQILHSNSATPPSSINDHPRYASIRIDRPYHSPEEPSSRDPSDSVDYRIPSELPDNREAYPSTTSRINRDIKSISAVQYGAGAAGSLNYDMVPGTRTRHATEDLSQVPGEEQRPNAVLRAPSNKRTLALPEPVMQHPSYVGHHPIYVGTKHHTALLRLINLTHEPTFLPPDLTNFPNPGVMSTCVGLYFEHFHPVMPVLRPEAFRDIDRYLSARDQGEEGIGVDFDVQSSGSGGGTSTGPPASNILEYQSHPYYPFLLLTMCAIGATYAKQDWKSMAIYMNELARRAGKHLRDRDSRAVFSKQYMQARLLQAVAGLAIGSRDLYLESEMTRSILVSAARRSNLLRPSKAHANTPPPAFSQPNVELSLSDVRPESIQLDDSQRADERENEAELELRWYKWLEEEERRRLGWGIYIADSQGASILNVPATFALDEIHAALPSTKELWIAPSAAAWYAAVKRAHRAEPTSAEPQPFSRVLRETLQEGTLPRTVSDFGKNIIAHTLYRICIEASALNKLLVGDSASISHDVRHGSFPPNLKYDPYTLLERLGVSWHDSVEHPSYFLITNDALRHHAYYKLVHPQFLDQVKYAAGQWESDASKSTARQWLTEWTAVNPADSRRVMAHSAQMAALLSRFTWDACWEPVWVLDCCLAMWAVVKFGGKEVLNMSEGDEHGLSSRKTTVKWSDAPDRVEEWVVSGGPTAFQGMQWEFTPRNILTDFMARLEAMPWNVSKVSVSPVIIGVFVGPY
ncbi:hypothetical protein QFC21_002268 [Naganishia friedmannii]|uniref:Uncharacterized protein n=1 Tax=Naganishia friedmannii TaxID=89922 RepID=A0ACC2VXG6_9TREE|nr:hypothetical protein QFC21_002268 [Naganishia friedmannii]